jgi:hypothetical protein
MPLEVIAYIEQVYYKSGIISFVKMPRKTVSLYDMVNVFIVNNIKCRAFILENCNEWIQFVKSCYSLTSQPHPDGWENSKGKKITFEQYMDYDNVRNDIPKYNDDEFRKNNKLITVYDERTKKRMIVDGLHRGRILTQACETNTEISEAAVYECYGENVNILFPADIHQL